MTRKQEAIRPEEGFSALDEIDFAQMDAVTGGVCTGPGCADCQAGAQQPQQQPPKQKQSGQGAQQAIGLASQLLGGLGK